MASGTVQGHQPLEGRRPPDPLWPPPAPAQAPACPEHTLVPHQPGQRQRHFQKHVRKPQGWWLIWGWAPHTQGGSRGGLGDARAPGDPPDVRSHGPVRPLGQEPALAQAALGLFTHQRGGCVLRAGRPGWGQPWGPGEAGAWGPGHQAGGPCEGSEAWVSLSAPSGPPPTLEPCTGQQGSDTEANR